MCSENSGFELRDHTADIALFVWGDSLESLFRAAASGLYATVGQLSSRGESSRDTLRFEATDVESLVQLADEAVLRAKESGKNKIL